MHWWRISPRIKLRASKIRNLVPKYSNTLHIRSLSTHTSGLRFAVVGSGPGGFYAAEKLLKWEGEASVDLYDRLATPYGLVRYGVAPDHPEVKAVLKKFEEGVARHPRCRFIGNVHVGVDLSVEDLLGAYHGVILAAGAEDERRLGIEGEDHPRVVASRDFVAWLNGHPDYSTRSFDFRECRNLAIIGQGNVALDVARMFLKPVDELKNTDITQNALEVLQSSTVQRVYLLGRRGPVQAAFTNAELREIMTVNNCTTYLLQKDLELDEASQKELSEHRQKKRMMELFTKKATIVKEEEEIKDLPGKKSLIIRFFYSPLRVLRTDSATLSGIELERNRLEGEPGSLKAVGTGETRTLHCDVVFRSIGYKGVALPQVPFDDKRGIVPNEKGRVIGPNGIIPGLYVSGWLKRGPSGIIGTNLFDAEDTVASVIEDITASRLPTGSHGGFSELEPVLKRKGVSPISFEQWKKIEAEEERRGQIVGKPREKITSREEMLKIAQ